MGFNPICPHYVLRMTKLIRQLDTRIKGSMSENEDWWRLMADDNGTLFVEHQWSHTQLKGLKTDADTVRLEIEDFLADDHPWASKARDVLRAHLREAKEGGGSTQD